jgi:UrcA family protein
MTMKITTIVSAAAAIIASSVCVSAATAAPAPTSVRVGVADLDLTSLAGQAVLDQRISLAARQACGNAAVERDLAMRFNMSRCFNIAIEKARLDADRMNAPTIAMR